MSLLVSACVSREYHQAVIPDPERRISNYHVEVGDRVQIQTKNGAGFEFQVTEVTEFTISGGHKELEFSDIQTLEVRRVDTFDSAKKTGGAVTMVLYTIMAIGMLVIAFG